MAELETKAAASEADSVKDELVAAVQAGDAARIARATDAIWARYAATGALAAQLTDIVQRAGPDAEPTLLRALFTAAEANSTADRWFSFAAASAVFQKPKDALEGARKALSQDAGHLGSLVLLARTNNDLGNGEAAREALDQLFAREPQAASDPNILLQSIFADIQRGQHAAALAVLDRIQPQLAALGREADYWVLRARALHESGQAESAIAAYGKAIPLQTVHSMRMSLARSQVNAALSARKWQLAAQGFDTALAELLADGESSNSERNAIRLQKAQALALHDVDLVLQDLDMLDVQPDRDWSPAIDLRVGGLLAAGRAEAALAWLDGRVKRASKKLQNHPAFAQLRSNVLGKLHRTREALDNCRKVLKLTGPRPRDARAAMAAMYAAAMLQRWNDVMRRHAQLVKMLPGAADDHDLRTVLALARLRLGDASAALAAVEELKPAAPDNQLIRDQVRLEALLALGRNEAALQTADKALADLGSAPAAEYRSAWHLVRTVALTNLKRSSEARDAATVVMEMAGGDLIELNRLAALMHRALAANQRSRTQEALQDIDTALQNFANARDSAIFQALGANVRDDFEAGLWFAKGVLLQIDLRNEEAIAAFVRTESVQHKYIGADVRRGYAILSTGALKAALKVFDTSVKKARVDEDRAEALIGRATALVRLQRFDDAIACLHQALHLRLMSPNMDPKPFELLGIAYDALQRNGAALRAFRRAWKLTPEKDLTANLARGVVAAELRLEEPAAALKFLDELPAQLKKDRTLLFNRALALDGLGRRREAIDCLVEAKEQGLDKAQKELERLDTPTGLARWTDYWFGAQARGLRPRMGWSLVAVAALGLAAPLFQWLTQPKLDWFLFLVPSGVALVLLMLPNLKSLSLEAGKVKLSAEPLPATGREAAVSAAPDGFRVPSLSIPITRSGATG